MSFSGNSKLGSMVQERDIEDNSWRVNLGQSKINLSNRERSDDWWTGLKPIHRHCPGVTSDNRIYGIKQPNLDTVTRNEVLDYFNNGWTITEVLFSGIVDDEGFYRPPYHQLRHPLVFYYIHPAVFYVNKLLIAGLISEPVDPTFESLFDIGVDEMSWDDMSKNSIKWPSIDECLSYRRKVHSLVTGLIENVEGLEPGHKPIRMDDKLWALFMGFEHERIHIETSSVLIRQLPQRLVSPPVNFPVVDSSSTKYSGDASKIDREGRPKNSIEAIPSGLVKIGKPLNFPSYGWDNEYGERVVEVDSFKVSTNLISNSEFLEFVNDGGYDNEKYWLKTGWEWKQFGKVTSPTFWSFDNNTYRLRTIYETIAMPWSWPVIVNFYEAKAYAKWKTEKDRPLFPYRLLTEVEHMRLRQEIGLSQITDINQIVDTREFNIHFYSGSESPVDRTHCISSPLNDVFGNVWQWMEDHFNPISGFKTHPYYEDFSTPCFDGEHHMVLGGSFISIGDEATPFARYHFRPHFFQHAGFRLAKSVRGDTKSNAVYLDS